MFKRCVIFLNGGIGRRIVPILLAALWLLIAILVWTVFRRTVMTQSPPLERDATLFIFGPIITIFALIVLWGGMIVKIDNQGLPSVHPSDGGIAVIGGVFFLFYVIGYAVSGRPILGYLIPNELDRWIAHRTGIDLLDYWC